MRTTSADEDQPLTWTQLNAQKEFFKNNPELFKYLQAAQLFYVQKNLKRL